MLQPIKKFFVVSFFVCSIFIFSSHVFARGGGGGSSGSSGSGGGSYHSSSYSNHSSNHYSGPRNLNNQSGTANPFSFLGFFFLIAMIVVVNFSIQYYLRRYTDKRKKESSEQVFAKIAEDIYFKFQKAWSDFDVVILESVLSKKLYKQVVLELNVLKNEGRKNNMEDVVLFYAYVSKNKFQSEDTSCVTFDVEIAGKAKDSLIDVVENKILYTDSSRFEEYWTIIKENDVWKLDVIKQSTESEENLNKSIKSFSDKNNFFYNADFGWLMMPNKGDLFSKTDFEVTDINNHVVGYYKEKIVEFYSVNFSKNKNRDIYFVGQAILPKNYGHIVIKRKNKFSFFERDIKGLQKYELESLEFNKEFSVYSDRLESVTTFELLHPAFMEFITGLPYDVSIEVIGSFLYFYTNSERVDYDKLLEILSRAFDELKM